MIKGSAQQENIFPNTGAPNYIKQILTYLLTYLYLKEEMNSSTIILGDFYTTVDHPNKPTTTTTKSVNIGLKGLYTKGLNR